ncbi:CaiF/GrlA family transcriptional regulator [Citrobacter koseri]|uniref:CaiF/GrlA family transcriptional regulator n=1 Tax=Citrobacter koseri TaxID=545 RepID=UPI001F195A2A|nr:CaiF/GrlA family transcriptional regulator [Citrobacter koseri]
MGKKMTENDSEFATGEPLYLRVARWVLVRGEPVTRDDISREFVMPVRHAADIMTYIVNRRSDVIDAEVRVEVHGKGLRTARLYVHGVKEYAIPPRGGRKALRRMAAEAPENVPNMTYLRNLALGRR